MRRERFRTVLTFAAAAVLSAALACPRTVFAQDEEGGGPLEVELSHKASEARRAHGTQKQEELKRELQAKVREFQDEIKTLQERAEKLGKRHEIASGDVFIEVVDEPDNPEDVVDTGRIINPFITCKEEHEIVEHHIWSLRREDFRVWRPARVTIERPLGTRAPYKVRDLVRETERTVFSDVFLAIPFAITNSTGKDLVIGPTMWIVSENLRFTTEIGGFIAQQDIERTMFRDMASTADLTGFIQDFPQGPPVQAIPAGETRYGVGVFPLPDRELDTMTLVIEGLNNTYRFDRRQKRVLVVDFAHPGDEFYPYRESVEFRGKEWQWMWMWYEEFKVSPVDKFEVPTPTGASSRTLWSYQVTLTNSSTEPQELTIREFNTVVPSQASGVKVEVEFIDDGKSTIDKAKVMEELALPFKGDRFFSGTLQPDEIKVFPVIFDQIDINWESVYEQVQRGLLWDEARQRGISIGYGEEPLKPGWDSFLPDPAEIRRVLDKVKSVQLTEDKKKSIREEVLERFDEAMQRERTRYTLTANVTAECGIGSGIFRVVRSYFKDGVIEEEWIHKWEE